MQDIKKITMDIDKTIPSKINAKQNDTLSRFVEINLFNNNVVMNLMGHVVKIYAIKSDNNIIFNNVNVTDATNGKILVELTSQALSVVGDLDCELVIYGNDNSILSSQVFTINVQRSLRSDNVPQSENEITVFNLAISTMNNHIANTNNPHLVTKTQVGLGSVPNVDTSTTANITDSTDKRFVTEAEKVKLASTSGTNTGDQNLSGLVPKTTTVNAKALSGNITLVPTDIGAEPTIATKNTAFNQNFETATANIKMNGTVALGTSANLARADHVHPQDTTITSRPLTGLSVATNSEITATDTLLSASGKLQAQATALKADVSSASYSELLTQNSNLFSLGVGKNASNTNIDVSSKVVNGNINYAIEGMTIKNEIINGDFEIDSNADGLADGWIVAGAGSAVWSLSTDKCISGTKAQKTVGTSGVCGIQQDFSTIIGHIYYISIYVSNSANACTFNITLGGTYTGIGSFTIPASSNLTRGSMLCTPTTTSLRMYTTIPQGSTTYYDGAMVIDLTATYGAGNEPTLAWCDANLSYFNGIKSVGEDVGGAGVHKIDLLSIGKNKFIPFTSMEVGGSPTAMTIEINKLSGTPTITGFALLFNRYLDATKNYYISFGTRTGTNCRVRILDNNGVILASNILGSFTVATSGMYNICVDNNASTSTYLELSNVQIEEGSVATAYEPYTEDKITATLAKPLKKIGTVTDKLSKEGVVTRNISDWIDLLGSLNVTLGTSFKDYKQFLASISNFPNCIPLSATALAIKNNGASLTSMTPASAIDQAYFSASNLSLTVGSNDSGFIDSYTPASNELKSYLYGWKMCHGTGYWSQQRNELDYNATTWAEWSKSSPGVVGDSTGLEFTGDGANWRNAMIPTTLKVSTKYGLLYNVISTTIATGFVLDVSSAFPSTSVNKVVGNNKLVVTSLSTITTNAVNIRLSNTEPIGNKIKLKDIRVFELPTGSTIEADFTNLTADQLATKYLFYSNNQNNISATGVSPYQVSELTYTPSTWSEWTKPSAVGDTTGLELTSLGAGGLMASRVTSLKVSTKYGLLYNVVSSNLANGSITTNGDAFNYQSLSIVIGNNKVICTTLATFIANDIGIRTGTPEPVGNKIKLKDFRIFELPTGSQIETDFNTLTADDLCAKYMFYGLNPKNWKKVTDGTGLTTTVPTASYAGYTPYKMIYQLATPTTEVLNTSTTNPNEPTGLLPLLGFQNGSLAISSGINPTFKYTVPLNFRALGLDNMSDIKDLKKYVLNLDLFATASILALADLQLRMKAIALLTTETTADLKAKINEIINIWKV